MKNIIFHRIRIFREIIKYRWYKLLTRIEKKYLNFKLIKHILYNNLTFSAFFSFNEYVLDYYFNCIKFRMKLKDVYKNCLLNIGHYSKIKGVT
ncbi:MAG: hypothetical protein SVN78_04820 [Deferribacterota bacterium]|nr:hypothetical protein [Deferribacterota bacterium]